MTTFPPRQIEVIRLPGLAPYSDTLRRQVERRNAVEEGLEPNTLFVLEHAPVITMGRRAHVENIVRTPKELDALGITVCEADRGGDVTYHGPGQMVAYPIMNLNKWKPSIRWFLRSLEEVIIRQLTRYGLNAGRVEGMTGVWVSGAKVAAVGIGIHQWVTFHGTSLNVNPDMSHFSCIVPCGIQDKPVTSLAQLLGTPPPMQTVMDDFAQEFLDYFATLVE